MSFASDTVDLLEAGNTLSPSTTAHKNFLGKLGLRKPSVLSISSVASSTNSPNPTKRTVSPMQDEEKRKILKMLISPNAERKSSKELTEFMSLADKTIKAARSAENLCTNQVLRQESTHSLQVPLTNMGRKVTFSQVVDHLACSLSDSSSLSDISCGEEWRQTVSGTTTTARRHRKMYKPSRRARPRRPSRGESSYNGTSGSEERFESSLESIESYNNFQLKPLSGLALPTSQRNKINKISSADSLLSMIRNLASSKLNTSTPSSPQLSEAGDFLSSGYPTPLSTPDTPSGSLLSIQHLGSKTGGSQIMVSVVSPGDSLDKAQSDSQSQPEAPPTITLEVPSFNYGKCLSPIREMPSPLPTPCPSPLPTPSISRSQPAEDQSGVSECSSSLSFGSSVSRSSSLRKHINKAKTVPQDKLDDKMKDGTGKMQNSFNDSYSLDSGEGTFDPHDYCDGGTSDFSEISIPIPSFRSSSSSSIDGLSLTKSPVIPIILTSLYDSSENLCKPTNSVENTKTPRGKKLVKQRKIPSNIVIPQVSISFEDDSKSQASSNSSSNNSPLVSPSGKVKKRPPPLIIPDSNFFNFKDDVQSAPVTVETFSDVREESEELKQTKAASLDKNITLFKQKSVEEENLDNVKIAEEKDKRTDPGHFLGGARVVKQAHVEDIEDVEDVEDVESLESVNCLKSAKSYGDQGQETIWRQSGDIELISKERSAHQDPPAVFVLQMDDKSDDKSSWIEMSEIPNNREGKKQERFKLKDFKKSGKSWQSVQLGSPPLKKFESEFGYKIGIESMRGNDKKKLMNFEQPQSLDGEAIAPMIKITPMSDLESDSDSSVMHHHLLPVMDYLNPFCLQVPGSPHQVTVSTCTSDSNLSSSGYSSISSPGGSRRGSYHRICISESEDMSTPTTQSKNFFGAPPFVRRPSPLLKSPSCDSESSDQNPGATSPVRVARLGTRIDKRALFRQYRTDSETTDDQIPSEAPVTLTLPEIVVDHCSNLTEQESTESTKSSLHNSLDDGQEDPSGSSSRSESPTLSDKNSVILSQTLGRYNHQPLDMLYFRNTSGVATALTDSDSILDGVLSEVLPIPSAQTKKSSGARREKKVYRKKLSRSNSPTYASDQGKESYPIQTSPKKSYSNKRRFRTSNKLEFRTSSSTESLKSSR